MKPLCIVDTSSLIYLSEITVAHRSLHRWLWDEFKVTYSTAVWDEISRHFDKMGKDARAIKQNGRDYVWRLPTVTSYERALFSQPFERRVETGYCKRCRRPFLTKQPFTPDVLRQEDRGERHNCCVALDAVMSGQHRQVIFLTDDYRAIRDYAGPVFEIFPLGSIWSAHEFVLYLFVRHRKRFSRAEVESVLRDVTAHAAASGSASHTQQAQQEWIQRLRMYFRKVGKIEQVLSQTQGGT